ncbi:hypothetical protein ONZ51_g10653 [Trametes cubensis]|uniref:F-box domain-containing protein n=1 Tax=Trametes cubensis TaxID=1111947 RepID=A0AAD7TJ34_9APHY|nr:hypothetical protein ONZ51_g10653 [Trametes cubensis]
MPLDILMEIVVLLHPRDLLNLARTSKEWRAFLMNRRQEPLWKASRTRQEPTLPDLPPFLSEPAYANLMFFKHCSGCLKPTAPNVYWEFGLRLCDPECSSLLSLRYRNEHPDGYYTVVSQVGDTGYTYLSCVLPPRGSRHRQCAYLRSEINEFCQRWKGLTTKEEKVQFLQERHEAIRIRAEICKPLREWDMARKSDRVDELEALKEERFLAVQRRLADEGWDKELGFMGQAGLQELCLLRCVKKPTKLTAKAWSNMRGEVIEFMQKIRTTRVSYERQELVEQRIKCLCAAYEEHLTTGTQEQRLRHDGYELGPGDLAYIPVFAELLEAGDDTEVSKRSFLSLMAQERWPAYVAQWKERIKGCCKAIALADLAGRNVPVHDADNVLRLAVAEFRCRLCKETGLRWPDILNHRCFRSRSAGWRPLVDLNFDASVRFICKGDVFLVNPDSLRLHPAALEVVAACGQDYGKVTYEEMQACPVRLVCNHDTHWLYQCPRPRPLLDWRAAIDHRREIHPYESFDNRRKESPWSMVGKRLPEQSRANNVAEASHQEQVSLALS